MAPWATFFSQLRCDGFFPVRDPEFMALGGPSIRHLRGEAQNMQHFANVILVIPDPGAVANQVTPPARGPTVVWKAMMNRTLLQEGPQMFVLFGRQTCPGSLGDGGLQRPLFLETGLPAVDGVNRNPEMLGDLFIRVRAA